MSAVWVAKGTPELQNEQRKQTNKTKHQQWNQTNTINKQKLNTNLFGINPYDHSSADSTDLYCKTLSQGIL